MSIPKEALPLLQEFADTFSDRTFKRFTVLMFAAIVTTGRRTVANLLRVAVAQAEGAPSSYHRVLSQAQWSGLRLACALTRFIVRRFYPTGRIFLAGDDTVDEHRGKKVFGKARHRDAVRSSHSYTAHRYGHKWEVLSILVRFPFAQRPWALPILVSLYRSPKDNQAQGRRHRTPVELMIRSLRILMRWFPERRFVFAGDGGFGTHEFAGFAHRTRGRLTLVSRFYPNANLYNTPPTTKGRGRPRVKGAKQPSPEQVVRCRRRRRRWTVGWYGGGQRRVETVTETGQWYQAGAGLVPVRWVYVHDRSGTHRDEYLFTTDVQQGVKEVIETFTGRWNIETTFQEMRAYLGLETTRGWTRKTVLRSAPCLFGLYSVVAMLYDLLPKKHKAQSPIVWEGKAETTFSDAITVVRRWLWTDWIFATAGHDQAFSKLPPPLRRTLLYGLAGAA